MVDLQLDYKRQAAEQAATLVESGMVLGLGSGSTALLALERLGALIRAGALKDVAGYATSEAVRREAQRLGVPLLDDSLPLRIDLTIDGADEIDPDLNLIKGGGGALLREKIVAEASRRVIIVADESKLSPALGARAAVPVEVLPFGLRSALRYLESLGATVSVRQAAKGGEFRTDQGNLVLDCRFGSVAEPRDLGAKLKAHAGLLEHGLFLGLASTVIVAGPSGLRRLDRSPAT